MTMNTGGALIDDTGGGLGHDFELVGPLFRNGKYVIEFGDVLFEVDPSTGARITRFQYSGTDLLAGPSYNETYWGSTLWTSPESDWSQPPPVAHDSGPYDVISGEALPIVMTAASDSLFSGKQIKVQKTFDVDLSMGAISITYEIINTSATDTFNLAPWEVTRIPGGGLSFFPHVATSNATEGIEVDVQDGIAWFDHATHVEPGGQKLWADGAEGWVAHVMGNLLFIKQFPPMDGSSAAPGENEVELYSSNDSSVSTAYIELEIQGPYESMSPGQRVVLPVKWYLVPIPPGTDTFLGSSTLVDLVRQTID